MIGEQFDLNKVALDYINKGKEWLIRNTDDANFNGKTTTIQIEEDYEPYRIHQISDAIDLHNQISACSVVKSLGVLCLEISYI